MSYFEMDDQHFPLVTIRFTGKPTEETFEEYLQTLEALYDRGEVFGIVFDAREALNLPRSLRKRQAEWMDANAEMIEAQLAGTAFVISSAFIRSVIRAIFAIRAMPAPYTVMESIDEAEAWVRDQIREKQTA